jgi:hypothetical protein
MIARIFLILVVWSSSSQICFSQGCIVYKRENDGIFIGADSRMVSFTINESTRRAELSYTSVCKIGQVNNINFAVTGYAADIGVSEARNVFQNTPDFTAAIESFVKSFGQKVADILETDRLTKSDLYKQRLLQGTVVGGSLFFYYDNGILNGRVIRIVLVSEPSQKATIETRHAILDSIGIAGNIVGAKNVLYNKDVWKRGAAKGINNIIGIEKIANPTEVEGVAEILFVSTKNELEWVQRKKCQ